VLWLAAVPLAGVWAAAWRVRVCGSLPVIMIMVSEAPKQAHTSANSQQAHTHPAGRATKVGAHTRTNARPKGDTHQNRYTNRTCPPPPPPPPPKVSRRAVLTTAVLVLPQQYQHNSTSTHTDSTRTHSLAAGLCTTHAHMIIHLKKRTQIWIKNGTAPPTPPQVPHLNHLTRDRPTGQRVSHYMRLPSPMLYGVCHEGGGGGGRGAYIAQWSWNSICNIAIG